MTGKDPPLLYTLSKDGALFSWTYLAGRPASNSTKPPHKRRKVVPEEQEGGAGPGQGEEGKDQDPDIFPSLSGTGGGAHAWAWQGFRVKDLKLWGSGFSFFW